jgi:hypothetical protein
VSVVEGSLMQRGTSESTVAGICSERERRKKRRGIFIMKRTITAGAWLGFVNRGLLALAIVLLLTASLVAQDTPFGPAGTQETPVAPEGTQVATEQTPAAAANTDALRKAAQNPVASLISVPVQNNNNFGIDPGYRTQDVLNIQPVIPVKVNDNWNMIIRWITPIIYQPLPAVAPAPQSGVYGLGDMQPTFLLSPSKPHKLIWGVGPIFQLPTATSQYLGQGKLGIGPNVVALAMPGHFVLGVLANNIWSVAGSGSRPSINQMLLQYFINYNMKKGWYLTSQPIITANWEVSNSGRWVAPFGGGVGRIMKLGFQPVNISAQFYGNAVHPPGASPWSMRLQLAFLFPKLSKEQEKMLLQQKLKQMEQQPQKN